MHRVFRKKEEAVLTPSGGFDPERGTLVLVDIIMIPPTLYDTTYLPGQGLEIIVAFTCSFFLIQQEETEIFMFLGKYGDSPYTTRHNIIL